MFIRHNNTYLNLNRCWKISKEAEKIHFTTAYGKTKSFTYDSVKEAEEEFDKIKAIESITK